MIEIGLYCTFSASIFRYLWDGVGGGRAGMGWGGVRAQVPKNDLTHLSTIERRYMLQT